MAEIETHPFPNGFGIEMLGADLTGPLSEDDVHHLKALLFEYRMLCIRDQELTTRQLQAFGEKMGSPIEHVEEDLRMEDAAGVMSLSNADGRPERQRNGGAFWHTDLVFTEEPASFTMLNAVAVPETGGETNLADQVAAYDALPDAMKAKIDGLTVLHCYEGRRDGSMPTVKQPLVRRHPVTGRKALYGACGTCIGIDGMPDDEAEALLSELGAHAIHEEFVRAHYYKKNDVLIWDNAATLHCGPMLEEAEGPDDSSARIMHRCSVRGWPAPEDFASA